MALTYNQISAITERKFIKKLYDNIFDSNPLLARAKRKGWYEKLDGGQSILVPLNYAQVSASDWYEGSETLDTTDNENITSAEYDWKQLYANISIRRIDELKNSGEAQMLNFVKSKVKIAEKTMIDTLGTGLYSDGSNSKEIVGLRDIVAIDQTVGGISQTDNSWWQGKVDSSTTTLTVAAMQSRFNAAAVDADQPTVIPTTRALYNAYHALLQANQRFVDADSARGGFTSLMFNGVPVVTDSHCPAQHMFFLNEDYLHLFVHRDEDMRFEPFQKPINQNVKVGKVYWTGALGSSNNRLHAVMTALTG